MKKIILGASLALVAGVTMANDHDYDDRVYITPSVSFVKPDGDKNVQSALALGIGIGKFMTEKLSFDLEFDRSRHDSNSGDNTLTQKSLGVIGRYHFDEKMGLRPYLGLGLGLLKSSFSNDTNAIGTFAAGMSKSLTEKVKLRTEFRYRLENNDDINARNDTYGDYLFNAGLSIAMGERSVQSTKTTLVEQAPIDSDKDGISDANDRCPQSPMGANVDSTGCAIVDGDDDNDGVPNSRDVCPNSRAGAVVGSDGCEVKVVIELQGVHFDTDKSTLKDVSISILNAAVKTMGEHGTIMVEVAGHTDSRASEEYNQALSHRRAKVVFDYLVAHGISADRMTWKGYGENSPIATNDTDEGMARNRRTELIVK